MKKAIVSIVIGDAYHRIYNHVAPLNRAWMERWGWDLIIIDFIPDDFRTRYSKKDKPAGWVYNLYKLLIPSLFKDYDLIACIDSDCVINPDADCLSKFIERIPDGGFAGVQVISYEDRKLFPDWSPYYYDAFGDEMNDKIIRNPKRHINGGLLLYRPNDVCDRWFDLLELDTNLNEEYRLNFYEVQEDQCFSLPSHWNTVWLYERVCRGWSKGAYKNKLSRKLNQCFLGLSEKKKVNMVFKEVSMLHFASEHQKMMLIDPTLVR